MDKISDLKEKGKDQVEHIKTLFDELQVQMALGKKEAKDIYDKERKLLYDFISKERALLQKTAAAALEHEKSLMEKLASLQKELDEPVPNGKKKFDNYKTMLLQKIYDVEFAIKTESKEVRRSLQKQLDFFKTKLDGYRLQVAMSNYENRDKLEERKTELGVKINEIRGMVKNRQVEDEKWNRFAEEVSESYKHLKNAFSDLLS